MYEYINHVPLHHTHTHTHTSGSSRLAISELYRSAPLPRSTIWPPPVHWWMVQWISHALCECQDGRCSQAHCSAQKLNANWNNKVVVLCFGLWLGPINSIVQLTLGCLHVEFYISSIIHLCSWVLGHFDVFVPQTMPVSYLIQCLHAFLPCRTLYSLVIHLEQSKRTPKCL